MANEFEYFPLYYRRLFIDTVDMSTLAFGAYMRLLLHAWDQKPVGTLPNDASTLARIARVSDAEWNEVAPAVLVRFKDLEKPRLRQKKMRQVYDALRELANSKSALGSRAAKARWHKEKHADALQTHCVGNAKENQTKENQTEEKTKDIPGTAPRAGAGGGASASQPPPPPVEQKPPPRKTAPDPGAKGQPGEWKELTAFWESEHEAAEGVKLKFQPVDGVSLAALWGRVGYDLASAKAVITAYLRDRTPIYEGHPSTLLRRDLPKLITRALRNNNGASHANGHGQHDPYAIPESRRSGPRVDPRAEAGTSGRS